MGRVREMSEALWSGSTTTETAHPFTPLGQLEEVAPRTAFVSGFANVTALDTDEGLVMIDTGSPLLSAPMRELVRSYSERHAHTIVWTHGHLDHVWGAELYEDPRNPARIVAHARVPARFDRYALTRGYNSCINTRQFGYAVEWPEQFRRPTLTYHDRLSITVGGEVIELHHALGETDDATWVWVPGRRVLLTGDLFIWATPNAGNPQKAQRYPREWAEALRTMASQGAELLLPGHGVPIFGAERVKRALCETAELLEALVEGALALMNQGARLEEVLRAVRPPAHLLDRPYLRPVYDEPEFILRNVWRQYGGWWDGNPANLKPAPDAVLAAELARLAGGADRLAARANELAVAGEHALACHLVEAAWQASPGDDTIRTLRARIYAERSNRETSLMARGIFSDAAERSRP